MLNAPSVTHVENDVRVAVEEEAVLLLRPRHYLKLLHAEQTRERERERERESSLHVVDRAQEEHEKWTEFVHCKQSAQRRKVSVIEDAEVNRL